MYGSQADCRASTMGGGEGDPSTNKACRAPAAVWPTKKIEKALDASSDGRPYVFAERGEGDIRIC